MIFLRPYPRLIDVFRLTVIKLVNQAHDLFELLVDEERLHWQ